MSSDPKRGPTRPTSLPSVQSRAGAPIGQHVKDRYRIVSELGAGAFGSVCLAEDQATGHEVAIRFLPRGLAGASDGAQAIQRMGRSLVATSRAHPALTEVLEICTVENGQAFVAMELVKGPRLSEILSEGPLDVGAALRLALELGGAVETLHNMGLIHGALRPRNVVVLEDGSVKLLDLELTGLRDLQAMKDIVAEEAPPEYLSPEEIRGQPATEKTDVYAFGVMLYEMLCGAPPFQAETREALRAKHLTETPVPIRRRRRAVPVSVDSVVALALSKQPELRPPMQNVLNRLWEEANGPETQWKRIPLIVGGATLAVSIAVLMAWGLSAPRPSAPPPLAQPAPPPVAEQAPISAPPTSSAPTAETRSAPTVKPAPPAVMPAVVPPQPTRVTPPSASPPASPRARAERREQPRVPQTPSGPSRERAAASSEAEDPDPGAVVDWLLERAAARRGQ